MSEEKKRHFPDQWLYIFIVILAVVIFLFRKKYGGLNEINNMTIQNKNVEVAYNKQIRVTTIATDDENNSFDIKKITIIYIDSAYNIVDTILFPERKAVVNKSSNFSLTEFYNNVWDGYCFHIFINYNLTEGVNGVEKYRDFRVNDLNSIKNETVKIGK